MKIKQRITSALLAITTAFSLMSTVSHASNLRFDVNGDGHFNSNDALYIMQEWL